MPVPLPAGPRALEHLAGGQIDITAGLRGEFDHDRQSVRAGRCDQLVRPGLPELQVGAGQSGVIPRRIQDAIDPPAPDRSVPGRPVCLRLGPVRSIAPVLGTVREGKVQADGGTRCGDDLHGQRVPIRVCGRSYGYRTTAHQEPAGDHPGFQIELLPDPIQIPGDNAVLTGRPESDPTKIKSVRVRPQPLLGRGQTGAFGCRKFSGQVDVVGRTARCRVAAHRRRQPAGLLQPGRNAVPSPLAHSGQQGARRAAIATRQRI